ncbi:MAG: PA0069 family radical SAM protein [Hyphomonadaceae bacterium]
MPLQPDWKTRSQDADWSRERTRARGRGALSNASGRFEAHSVTPFEDGWEVEIEDLPPFRTETIPERPKTVITRNSSPDIHFDRTINPYKGCEHGCIYCYARPNHAWRGLSAGIDFERKIFVKPGAADVLRRELSRKTYKVQPVMLAGDTDIYQPIERELKITRSLFEVLSEFNHPAMLITKSATILRDLDLIASMAERNLISVAISLTTLDSELARHMEPRASTPRRRLQAIQQLATLGVPVSVMTAPLIPALNEPELENLLEAAAEAGAQRAGYVLLRLPLEIAQLFQEWLEAHYPDRARRVMSLMRSMHGGKDYRSDFGLRQRGDGPYAQMIQDRFSAACRRLDLSRRRGGGLRCDLFRPPSTSADAHQLSLFDDTGAAGAAIS